jgi:quercetin dioxygenase-like cupin family protein
MKIEQVEPMGSARGKDGRGLIWESDAERPLGFEPRRVESMNFLPGGIKVTVVDLPPQSTVDESSMVGIAGLDKHGFHKTSTLDIVILLAGKMTLDLEEESVELEMGDVVVQRGTNHAWRNTGDSPSRILGIQYVIPS